MRIHLPLLPQHFTSSTNAVAGPSNLSTNTNSPLVQIGGDLVLIELQGELSWEGNKDGGVVGVMGFERPDKPTLYLGEHHLLHGKITNLQKPYAVIRRVLIGGEGSKDAADDNGVDEEDEEEDEDEEDDENDEGVPNGDQNGHRKTNGSFQKKSGALEDDDETDPPLFPPSSPPIVPHTPARSKHILSSSSPFLPPSSIKDYSSELDPSSPPRSSPSSKRDRTEDEDDEAEAEKLEALKRRKLKLEQKREQRRKARSERARHYEVVGVVRKKVVFALRPEPIVTATVLPE